MGQTCLWAGSAPRASSLPLQGTASVSLAPLPYLSWYLNATATLRPVASVIQRRTLDTEKIGVLASFVFGQSEWGTGLSALTDL